jgi:sugar lactone lactonase YvrE
VHPSIASNRAAARSARFAQPNGLAFSVDELSGGDVFGRVLLPERVANLTFGGPKRNRLYITATSSLYSVLLAVSGAKTF